MRRLALILPLLALGAAAMPGHAPRMRIASIQQLPQPLPAPYRKGVDARAELDAALARARVSGKPVLIDFGANWCADCRVLAGVLEQPELKTWMAQNYELVQVDVGRFERNLDIPKRFGAAPLDAIPAVLVIDGKTCKLRNRGQELALGDARIMTPQSIANWLAKWPR